MPNALVFLRNGFDLFFIRRNFNIQLPHTRKLYVVLHNCFSFKLCFVTLIPMSLNFSNRFTKRKGWRSDTEQPQFN